MTTGRVLVKKAMQKAGILTLNEDPSSDEINDGLESINNMLASWSNESMKIVARTKRVFNMVGGQLSYTIGAGGDFNTPRPLQIVDAYFKSGDISYPVTKVTDENYDAIPLKTVQGYPQFFNYDYAYPLGTLRFFPVPSANFELTLLCEQEITALQLDVDLSMPPGWERAIIYNGAQEISGEYGREIPASIVQIAQESKANVMRAIIKNRTMDAQPLNGSNWNIYSGYYWG